jgi:hypothetical protein
MFPRFRPTDDRLIMLKAIAQSLDSHTTIMEAFAQQLRLAHGVLSFEIVPVNRAANRSPRRQRPALSRWDSAPPLLTISSDHGNGSSPIDSSRKVMRKSSSARDFMPRLPSRSTDVVAPPLLLPSRETRRPPAPQVTRVSDQSAKVPALPISPTKALPISPPTKGHNCDLLVPRRPHRQSIDSVVSSPGNRSKQIVQLRSA